MVRAHGRAGSEVAATAIFLAVLLWGLSGGSALSQSAQDAQGGEALVLRYGDVADALTARYGGNEPTGRVKLRPAPPPSDYTREQQNDYWLGATSQALGRCGYYSEGMTLRGAAQDIQAFEYGANRLKGSQMINCAKVKRLGDRLSADFVD